MHVHPSVDVNIFDRSEAQQSRRKVELSLNGFLHAVQAAASSHRTSHDLQHAEKREIITLHVREVK